MNERGYWNRAARRSGGERPLNVLVARTVMCGGCGTETPVGALPETILPVGGDPFRLKSCPSCSAVLLVHMRGTWMTADESWKEMVRTAEPTGEAQESVSASPQEGARG